MNLDEAIEIASDPKPRAGVDAIIAFEVAIKLLIEAGKRLQQARTGIALSPYVPLDSETKEYIPRNIGRLPSDEDCEKGGTP